MRNLLLATLLIAGFSHGLAAQAAPYDVDRRRQPRGTELDSLLPLTVGPFRRAPFAPRTPVPVNQALAVKYGAGPDSVVLAFRIPGKPEDAQAAVGKSRDDAKDRGAGVKDALYAVKQDPSYFKADRIMAWSRAGYFFDARASSAGALDRFMQPFPY